MNVIERIAYSLIRKVVTINWNTFGKIFIQMTLSLLQAPRKSMLT